MTVELAKSRRRCLQLLNAVRRSLASHQPLRLAVVEHEGDGGRVEASVERVENRAAMTPLTLLERAAEVFPERLAIAHGRLSRNYRDFQHALEEARLRADEARLRPGDTVAAMLANTPATLECHYGVPMSSTANSRS